MWTCFDILHLIFCDSHRAGDGQKPFLDTVVEYSTCKYLGNYLNGKHNRHTTCVVLKVVLRPKK